MSESGSAGNPQVVNRLIRVHNLLFFVVVVWGLACFLIVKATHIYREPPAIMWLLTTISVLLPVLTLVLSALLTGRWIRRAVQRAGNRPLMGERVVACFVRSKMLSTLLGAVAGLFAMTCLLFSHRVREGLLAVFPLLVMLLMRPTPLALVHFVRLAEMEREDQFGET